jgi:UDP-glucose 4-epimerase
MKNVFITGVSGYIGGKIANALNEIDQVDALIGIDIKTPLRAPDKLTFIHHDIRKPIVSFLRRYGIDTIIHAAYVLPPLHDKALMEDINITGTRNVLTGAAEAGVTHLLYTSSATAYGFHPDNPVPLNEEHPLRGNDDFTYSKNKKEIEALMAEFKTAHKNIILTILRPCFVVGPGFDNPLSRHLIKPLVLIATQTAPMQFVHEDDLTRMIILCLKESIGGIYNVAGEGTLMAKEMIRMLGNRLLALPFPLLYAFNQIAWALRLKFLSEFPSPALNMLRYPWIVSPQKFIDATGFKYQFSSRSAFEDFARTV